MDTYLNRYFIYLLLITLFSSNTEATKNATSEEPRSPRVIGRIVKLYSGYKPGLVHCRGEGFQGDPVDCSAFYRCMKSHNGKFTVLRFTCGPGTIYDPETEICNHPQHTKRSECRGDILLNNQPRLLSKNTKEIENEIGEILQEVPTPITTKIPDFAGKRTAPTNVAFPLSPWFSSLKENKDVYATVQPNLRFTRQDTPALNKLSRSQQGPSCTLDGFMGDNADCRKFYRCVSNLRGGFIRHEYFCSESTVWDNAMQTCNHPWATARTQCGGKIENSGTRYFNTLPKSIKNNIPAQQQIQISYGSKVSQTQSQISHGPVIQNQTQINFGNKMNNASRNSEVSQNQTQISYDSAVSQTQQQINYGNKGVQTQSQIDHTNDASQTQTQEYEGTTTMSSSSVSPVSSNNNNECISSGFMGDSKNCKKFYRCVDNGKGGYTKYEFTCGEGTAWDQTIEACNHAWAVKDCSSSEPTKSTSTTEKITTNYYSTESEPNKNEESNATEQDSTTTPAPNSIATTEVSPISNTNENNECQHSGFKRDNNNCKKFYRCVDNGRGGYIRYEFSCGEGTVWDSASETCNHEWAVKSCGSKASTENSAQKEPVSTTQNEMNAETTTLKNENSIQNTDYDTGYGQIQNEQLTTTIATSSSPSESHSIGDSQCKSSGFIGDNQNCKKFYRCVDDGKGSFTRYEFYCGEGTVWDQSIKACNHEWAVENCGMNGLSTSSMPTTTQSHLQSNSTESNINNDSSTASTEKTTTFTAAQVSDGTDSQSETCKKEGFEGDSKDCTKFHRCVDDGKGGFTIYDFKCGEGTVWDQKIQSCNHPSSQNNCSSIENNSNDDKPEPVHDETDTATTGKSTSASTEQSETTILSSTQPILTLNNVCEFEGFYGNPDDCKKFYRCVNDGKGKYTKYDFICGEGTIWDQEITACNHDNGKTDCHKISVTSKPDQTQTESVGQMTTTTASSSNIEEITKKPDSDSNSSSEQCTSDGFYANNKDCKKFYRCVDNGKGGYTKYDFTCGEGTMWVQEIQACDHDDDSMECKTQGTSITEPPRIEEQPTQEPNPIMQDEEATQTTEGFITTNSPTTQNSNSMSKDNCQEEGYFGNTEDCTKFYRCVDNGNGGLTKYDFTCGEGTIWDQDVTTCNHPQDVSHPSCKEQSNSESSSSSPTSSTSSSSTETSSTTESSQNSSGCSQEESSKKPGNKNVTCEKAGFYPDPNDCKKFYRCVDWDGDGSKFSVFHFDCGEGTIWDPALDTCNYEDSVYPPRDCSGSQSQNENVSHEPTTTDSTTTEQSETTSSSSEATVQQPTITEQSESTSQGSTTTEKGTTQKATTSQQTTQQLTTSEKSTTQQSTTSEKTTTQQSTTSKQTTTQQTSTSEPTTTHQSTFSEQTTTQQSTSSEITTEQTTQQTEMEQTTQESSSQSQTTETSNTEESTTNQQENQTTTESEQVSTTESSSSSEDKCPETDDDQNLFVCPTSFRRHPKYCNLFYQCTEDDDTHDANIAVFHCPNNTIYDESKTQCIEEKKADKKCDGEIAQRRRLKRLYSNNREPIVVSKEKHACPAAGHYPFEKNEECSPAFLKCSKIEAGKLRGYVYRCPEGYVYWSVSRRCETKSYLKDCKYTSNDWSRRWEIPLERSNVAKY